MEEKERFMNTIESVNNDNTVMQEWILEENERLKNEGQISYAKEEGRKEEQLELIKNMLEEGLDYSIISKVTGKTIEKIKEIACTIEE